MAKPENKTGLSNIVAEWLWEQLKNWVGKGIITEEQQASIKNLYLWPPHVEKGIAVSQSGKPVNMILILEVLGALLIGIGLLTFVAFNWPLMPGGLKVGIVLSLITVIHAGSFWLKEKTKYVLAGQALSFLGNLAFGAGIWLIAQIYNLPSNFPRGMLIWAIGVLPMAFTMKSKTSYFLSIVLFVMWTMGESFGNEAPQPIFLLVLLGLLVPVSYYLKSKAGLAVCVLTGGLWLVVNNFLWMEGEISGYLMLPIALYGLLLILVSNLHEAIKKIKSYQIIYRISGLIVFGSAIIFQPFYGVAIIEKTINDLGDFGISFWICNAALLIAILGTWLFNVRKELGNWGDKINKLTPVFLVAALYNLTLPLIKASVLPTLFGMLIIIVSLWLLTKAPAIINLSLLYFSMWLLALQFVWEQPIWFGFQFLLLALLIYLKGWKQQFNNRGEGQGSLHKFIGLFIYFGFFFILTMNWFREHELVKIATWPKVIDFWVIIGSLLVAIGFMLKDVFLAVHPKIEKGLLREEQVLLAVLSVLPLIVFVFNHTITLGTWFVFVMNGLFIFSLIAYLICGYRRRAVYLKIMTCIYISLFVIVRYFEMDWGLLAKAFLMVITGVVILVIGILFEKNKEKVAILDA